MSEALRQLSDLLGRLPGIGRRNAQRLSFHLVLRSDDAYVQALAQAIGSVRSRVQRCSVCRNLCEQELCEICSDPRRDHARVCVVASVPDLWAVEESHAYRGAYFVLHGLLAPLEGLGPDDLGVDHLRQRVERDEVQEVIVATRPSLEGEATASLVRTTLAGLPLRMTRLASGISYGGELEFADSMTLSRAFADRKEMS
ncbi:MAG: recombination mediator RecR [Myxococcota bacterium]|nr:recombination mediator RecR [Myxococcota bacterium]